MNAEKQLISRALDAPFHRLFRSTGRPVTVPLEISFALTYKCANRCRTCKSISRAMEPDMAPEEYSRIFNLAGFSPMSLVFTGGEPFMREDFSEIVSSACRNLDPAFVFMETCGDLPEIIGDTVRGLCASFPSTCFVVKLPLDGTGEQMGRMRGGAPDAFELFMKTFRSLESAGASNLGVVLSVLVSAHNIKAAPALLREAFMLYPDAVALEFAGPMEALGTSEPGAPDEDAVAALVEQYKKLTEENKPVRGLPRVLADLYAGRAAARPRRCYAGFSSIYISPQGTVMDCPGRGRMLGELKKNDYSLQQVLDSRTARLGRKLIRSEKCCCPATCGPVFSNLFLTASGCARLAAAAM